MTYLLAAVGAITIAVLMWKAFGPRAAEATTTRTSIAPDDDPDFLRKLGEKHRKPPAEDPPA
ncbi:hypothetical protein SAMN05192558_113218 [Actinokineospora alba]|uniref:Uncharacterized protein n=1 Tax=Actinokineospora alba TaxID=504798 RepID=A0A1H0VEE5_9PSEU|nr:hypothetical protein [Actinokineospora alba]TDP65665.1 hypothetical protein C8E96_1152 [Actinokineospora alba]SDH67820.1 hypothetical protein SAMN05421871_101972 [Actinokineospora alba]SDP76588.1 hypothetical protein SAMN05192558_113218 [Actinokineospora alba]